jgi:hypothetical protein
MLEYLPVDPLFHLQARPYVRADAPWKHLYRAACYWMRGSYDYEGGWVILRHGRLEHRNQCTDWKYRGRKHCCGWPTRPDPPALGRHPKVLPLPTGVVPVAVTSDGWKCLAFLSRQGIYYAWQGQGFQPVATLPEKLLPCQFPPIESKYRSLDGDFRVQYGGRVEHIHTRKD